jgi:hypothetical protein
MEDLPHVLKWFGMRKSLIIKCVHQSHEGRYSSFKYMQLQNILPCCLPGTLLLELASIAFVPIIHIFMSHDK